MHDNQIKILLIEDNPGDVRLIQEMLKESVAVRYELSHADCLSSGMEFLTKSEYDVLLLDLGLPESQGPSTLNKILSLSLKLPIVVLTSLTDERSGVMAVQKGIQDYLVKGRLDSNLLVHSIRYAIERKKLENELVSSNGFLEQRVSERTFTLECTNKKLQLNIEELRQTRERIELLFRAIEQSTNTIVITDEKGNIEYINPKGYHLTGYTPEEIIGKNTRIFKTGETLQEEYKRLWASIASGREWRGEFRNKKKNGEFYWEYASISPIKDSKGFITHFIAIKEDITERKRFEAHLEYLANNDPLTNLFNRRRFREEMADWIAQMERHESGGALLFIDLDNFKYINDTLGHQKGDEILINFAYLLRARVRETDIIARLGGDEFAIILPYTDAEQAQSIAMQILELARGNIHANNGRFHNVTASIGIALFPEHGNDAEKLLTYADLAMYRSKEKGRNCICMYSPDQKKHYELRLDWEERIRNALKNNKFVLHLQPISNVPHKKIMGYEALLRMVDENDTLISPSEFLNIAERFGLIHDIDRWVVCRAIHLIAEQQFTERGLFLEVNLSGRAFNDPELLPLIKQEFAATNINPETLVFEITETATIENMVDAQRFITTLKGMGCRFGLDDFGIGFSSFSYLKQLPVDYLKIDGSFISELKHNQTDQHLVKAMVEVARGLGKQTIAEFVGCEETVRLLSKYGVDYAQGHYIGKPGAVSEISAYSENLK
ncbi:MAG TPA: EAL domain-containing protein [Candidatus Wunengus sp. YC60]|uniref:EAL domain-containing protein n=1 Tax=Candidatus Wunengus sp. YC60 TaxID=3367697 RepID=UPI004029D62F